MTIYYLPGSAVDGFTSLYGGTVTLASYLACTFTGGYEAVGVGVSPAPAPGETISYDVWSPVAGVVIEPHVQDSSYTFHFAPALTLEAGLNSVSYEVPAGVTVINVGFQANTYNGVLLLNNVGWGTVDVITVTAPPSQYATVGVAYPPLQIMASDSAPGQTLTFTCNGLSPGLTLSESGLITGTPTTAGQNLVTVTATDGTGASGTSAPFLYTIAPADVITVANPGAQAVTAGTAFSLQMSATDSASGQTLVYTAAGLPAGLSISAGGLITGTPTTAGTGTVTVTATDAKGAHGSAAFTMTVSAAPSGGGTISGGFATANVGPYKLQVNEWDSAATLELSYSYPPAAFSVADSAVDNAAGGSPASYSSIFSGNHWGTVSPVNPFPLQVSAIAAGEVTTSITTALVSGGDWNLMYDIWFVPAPGGIQTGTDLEMIVWLNQEGTAVPAGSQVATATVGGNAYKVWWDGSTVTFQFATPVTGVANLDLYPLIQYAVAAGYLQDSWYLIDVEAGFELWQGGTGLGVTSFSVNIGNVPPPPPPPPANVVTVANPGAQSLTVGTAFSLQPSATDSGADQVLTWAATGLPPGLSISSLSGLISGTPATAGFDTVTVIATDGTGAHGSATFAATVSSPTGISGTIGSGTVSLGPYTLQVNEWNSTAAFDLSYTYPPAAFTVSASAIDIAPDGAPGAYPSIYSGNHWGNVSPVNPFPLQVSAITAGQVTTSMAGTIPGGAAYDFSYDIWFVPASGDIQTGPDLEMMIWLNHGGGTNPAGSQVATVTLDGVSYEVWDGTGGGNGGTVSYVFSSGVTSVANLDLYPFIQDAVSRGYLNSSWWLIDVEGGFETWSGCQGLEVNSFSVTVGSAPPPPPADTVTVTSPGAQSAVVGTAFSLAVLATDSAAGQTLTFTASGLPAGLAISAGGVISGTPSSAGSSTVTVTATDTTGAHGSAAFAMTVSAATGGGGTNPPPTGGNVTVDFRTPANGGPAQTPTDPLGAGVVITEFGGNPVPLVSDTGGWKSTMASLAPGHLRCSIAWYSGDPGYGAGGSSRTPGTATALIEAVQAVGAIPLVSYNGDSSDNGGLTTANAAALVEYLAALGVKYFSVGNEPEVSGPTPDYAALIPAMAGAASGVVIGAPAAAYWDTGLLESVVGIPGLGAMSYHAYDGGDAPGSDNGGGGFYETGQYFSQTGTMRGWQGGILYGCEELNWNSAPSASETYTWQETCWIADVLGQLLSSGAHGTVYGDSNGPLSVISDGSGGLPAFGTPMPAYWGIGIWTGMAGAFKRWSANMVHATTTFPDTSVSVYACDNGKIVAVNKDTAAHALVIDIGGPASGTYNVNATQGSPPTGIAQVVTGAGFSGGVIGYTIPAQTVVSIDVSLTSPPPPPPNAPAPPAGYVQAYYRDFATQGIGDWSISGGTGSGIQGDAAYGVSENGLGITVNQNGDSCGLTSPSTAFGPGAFIQGYVYLPGQDGEIANWPAFWAIGAVPGPTSTDGEIDIVEGLGGAASWHVHSPAGGPGGSAAEGQYIGWHYFSAYWDGANVTFWYDDTEMGTEPLTTTENQQVVFTNTAYGVSWGDDGGPSLYPGTAYLATVGVWRPGSGSGEMPAPAGYATKIFEDQFTGTELNTANWVTYLGAAGAVWNNEGTLPLPYSGPNTPGNNNIAMFGPSQVTVDNGCTLTAEVNANAYAGTYPWISGIITTEGLFSLPTNTSWYVQVKAKMPDTSTGMWPAIWFLPGIAGTASNELDGYEGGFTGVAGNINEVMHSDYFASQGQQQEAYSTGTDLSAGYNVYGIEFVPGTSITVFLNGTQVWQVLASSGVTITAEPYQIMLELQVMSAAGGFHTPSSGSTPASSMEIAEVQAWTP
jgi:glycosyl hydrolase family 12/putative Ig domain-containing protein